VKTREFKEFIGGSIDQVLKYLSVEMVSILRELSLALKSLSFGDNFESFQATLTLAAGEEAKIRNALATVPTKKIIVRHAGDSSIIDGAPWDINFVTLKNTGAAAATVTVIFMR